MNELGKFQSQDELIENTMFFSYMIITKQMTVEELFESDDDFGLLFDPEDKNTDYDEVIQILLDHFIYTEEYEKCQDLVDLRKGME